MLWTMCYLPVSALVCMVEKEGVKEPHMKTRVEFNAVGKPKRFLINLS